MLDTEMRLLTDPTQIDLERHGVVEAHAGTGKTYTIVQMVLRLLEKGTHIREVLLVTYTDKAAGELKNRIREELEKRIGDCAESSLAAHLSDCLNNMHEALIGTIHSVCLRILRMWPFDTGVQFQIQQCNDDDGLQEAFYHVVRTRWQEAGQAEAQVLALLQQEGVEIKDEHHRTILRLAKELLDDRCAQIDVAAMQGFVSCAAYLHRIQELPQELLAAAALQLRAALEDFAQLVEAVCHVPEMTEKYSVPLREKLRLLRELAQTGNVESLEWTKPAALQGKSILTRATTIYKNNKDVVEPMLAFAGFTAALELTDKAKDLRANPHKAALTALLVDTARQVSRHWQHVKNGQGLISFQDMLRLTHKAVLHNDNLVAQLRKKLRYGIIDEFQDTSVLQWQIFQKIFLEDQRANASRLFLVGDPKQSIYAFQGADVGSYSAARQAVVAARGVLYGLVANFRSLGGVIDAYNAVCGRWENDADWFCHGEIAYPGTGPGGVVARSPDREPAPSDSSLPPVQVIAVWGSAAERQRLLARHISTAIRSLLGTTILVPKGKEWKPLTLRYEDFAIVAETHRAALPFQQQLAADGIPAVKYKMEGVFQSEMCRHLRTLLRAVDPVDASPTARLAALLTPFFEYSPLALDPEAELGPGSAAMGVFRQLDGLAQSRRWGLFFAQLWRCTQVETRLARLAEGERLLCDLRQVADYALECLERRNWTLHELVEHLDALLAGSASLPDEQNLHALASERSAVRVLTMHASKGLEFPVVFVVTTSSQDNARRPMVRQWNTPDGQRHLALDTAEWPLSGGPWEMQYTQERRRKLYVALTRPQAALFVPVHLEEEPPVDADGQWLFAQATVAGGRSPELDLSPRLLKLIAAQALPVFDAQAWRARERVRPGVLRDALEPGWDALPHTELQERLRQLRQRVESLDLPHRKSLQTSYSELSRGLEHERVLGSSEEIDIGAEPEDLLPLLASDLPRGKDTGDALHAVLELGIASPDWTQLDLLDLLRQRLEANRVLDKLDEAGKAAAVAAAEKMVRRGLQVTYDLGPWGQVSLAGLLGTGSGACRAELEFQLDLQPDWMHGFMDVVFRLPDASNSRHPWRYFVLDWKTDSLAKYDILDIRESIKARHYDLQAQVYAYALHRFLLGLLGADYDPLANLGAAVYVYLRAFEYGETVPVWCHAAQPQADADYVAARLAEWKKDKA
jgi:exodeoxyribonuclease V beta subunit